MEQRCAQEGKWRMVWGWVEGRTGTAAVVVVVVVVVEEVGPAGKDLGRNRFRWFHWAGLGALGTMGQGRQYRLCLQCLLQVAVEGKEGERRGVDASGGVRVEEAVVNETLVIRGRWRSLIRSVRGWFGCLRKPFGWRCWRCVGRRRGRQRRRCPGEPCRADPWWLLCPPAASLPLTKWWWWKGRRNRRRVVMATLMVSCC
jgi:hypothetical protein